MVGLKMGMFDSFSGKWKCECGHINESNDIQTKELECILKNYKPGDKVSDKFNYITGVEHCESCKKLMEIKIHLDNGFYHGLIVCQGEW